MLALRNWLRVGLEVHTRCEYIRVPQIVVEPLTCIVVTMPSVVMARSIILLHTHPIEWRNTTGCTCHRSCCNVELRIRCKHVIGVSVKRKWWIEHLTQGTDSRVYATHTNCGILTHPWKITIFFIIHYKDKPWGNLRNRFPWEIPNFFLRLQWLIKCGFPLTRTLEPTHIGWMQCLV